MKVLKWRQHAEVGPLRECRGSAEFSLILVLMAGLVGGALLTRWMDRRHETQDSGSDSEELLLSPRALRRLSLGFNGLAADWYWICSLQYVGNKVLAHKGDVQLDNLRPLGLDRLSPLLERATSLDPQFMAAYEYGAVVLPAIDVDAAIDLLQKGIAANPQSWRLYQQLGYIYWQNSQFDKASEAYNEGARQPGAPAWMSAMAAQMEVKGGSRGVARAIYTHLFEQSEDKDVKQMALRRLMQIDSMDQRDVIGAIMEQFKSHSGRCPAAWKEILPELREKRIPLSPSGIPVDPSNAPYVLKPGDCEVEPGPQSEVLRN